jgi:hypothetical protein
MRLPLGIRWIGGHWLLQEEALIHVRDRPHLCRRVFLTKRLHGPHPSREVERRLFNAGADLQKLQRLPLVE